MKSVHSALISDKLEEEIVNGTLKPGTRLSEESIAQRFGVSRTPVREALQYVVQRSLAERAPYKGVVVCDVNADLLDTMFEAMAELEALCGGLAADRISDCELDSLKHLHKKMSDMASSNASREYEAMNLDFHSQIYEACGNANLITVASEMRLKLAPFRKSQLYRVDRLKASNQEHSMIVHLLASRNKPGVEEALRQHLMSARKTVEKYNI